MANITRHVVSITTDGSGNGTGYTDVANGFVQGVLYIPDGTAPFTGTPTFTITGEVSAEPILTLASVASPGTASQTYPRAATSNTSGAASLYAASGTAVNTPIPVGGERIKITVSGGGATKTGVFHVLVGG